MSSSTDTNATRCDNTPCNGGRAWLTDESDALDPTKKFCSADCADEWVAKQGDEDCDVEDEDTNASTEDPLDALLLHIAQACIDNNWHRVGEFHGGHRFTSAELREYNKRVPGEPYATEEELKGKTVVQLRHRLGWHNLKKSGKKAELVARLTTTVSKFDEGYVFLDEDGGTGGMIRFYSGACNPKWSFWKKDGVLKVGMA